MRGICKCDLCGNVYCEKRTWYMMALLYGGKQCWRKQVSGVSFSVKHTEWR